MSDPVNLDNLHEMTSGDTALEKELFEVYITTAQDCLDQLKTNTSAENEEVWRTQAHSLKGMSLNLGAEKLGAICATAQTEYMLPEEKKLEMFAEIESEFTLVAAFLKKV